MGLPAGEASRQLKACWDTNLRLKEELERLQEFRARVLGALEPLPAGVDLSDTDAIIYYIQRCRMILVEEA